MIKLWSNNTKEKGVTLLGEINSEELTKKYLGKTNAR